VNNFIALFPGQGSQSVGMMNNLSSIAEVKQTFEEASDILNVNFWDMVNVENTDINQTENTQPLMLQQGLLHGEFLKKTIFSIRYLPQDIV